MWEGNVFSISVCPQGRGGTCLVPSPVPKSGGGGYPSPRSGRGQEGDTLTYGGTPPPKFSEKKLGFFFMILEAYPEANPEAGGEGGTPLAVTQENCLVIFQV